MNLSSEMPMINPLISNTVTQNLNFDAYVLLPRLSEEEIDRLTGRNKKCQSTPNSSVQDIKIKQEFLENGLTEDHTNMVVNNTWQSQECTEIVKIETTTTTIREIKMEPLEDYGENIENPQISDHDKNIQSTFNCELCFENFEDFEMLIIHKSLYHRSTPYACEFCDRRFSLSLHLNIHITEHVKNFRANNKTPSEIQSSSKPNLACTYNSPTVKSIQFLQGSVRNSPKNLQNNKNFNQQKLCEKEVSTISTQKYCASNANKFLQNARNFKPFKCPNCLFSTASENKFVKHHEVCNVNLDNNVVPEKNIRCHLCIKTFKNRLSLNGHMRYHSLRGEIISKKKYKSNKLKSISKSQSNNHAQKSLYINKCKICNQNFTSLQKLNMHQMQHKHVLTCKICEKQYFFRKSFIKHMQIHENGTETTNNSNNTAFIEDHTISVKNSKPNSLKIKFSSTNTKENKKQKNNPLKNMNKFYCVHCEKYYKTRKSLSEHIRRYHANLKVKPSKKIQRLASVKCNWCSAVITKCNLMRHINSFHPNVKPLKCTQCSMRFKNHSAMKLHMNDNHVTIKK